jgi:hypothetical protein
VVNRTAGDEGWQEHLRREAAGNDVDAPDVCGVPQLDLFVGGELEEVGMEAVVAHDPAT